MTGRQETTLCTTCGEPAGSTSPRALLCSNGAHAPGFDADFSPRAEVNREAASARGLRYDPRKRAYVDEDGCLIRDCFGQRF